MRRREFITAALASLAAATAIAGVVEAGMKAGPNMAGPGHHRLKVPIGGALDTFTTPHAAYSFRKLLSAYTGNAFVIRRASDNAEATIGYLGFTSFTGAPWDEAAAAAHCNATNCFVKTAFDQSGAARDITQTTAANQPALIFNCNGTHACIRETTSTQTLVSAAYTPVSPLSISVVGKRVTGTTCMWLRAGANRLNTTASANTWALSDNVLTITGTGADNLWHSGTGWINGAASSFQLDDNAPGAATLTVNVTAGTINTANVAATTTCEIQELILWGGYALTATERTALTANRRSYGMIP